MNETLLQKKNDESSMIPVTVFDTEKEIGFYLAEYIISKVKKAHAENKHFLLGCPSGRSLQSTYESLGKMAILHDVSLSRLIFVMMDEYIVKNGNSFDYCNEKSHFSCKRYAYCEIMDKINSALPDGMRIKKENVWFPDTFNPASYDEKILQAGGVDIFLTASGASDGHVAFNPPGTEINTKSRIIELADTTRSDNMGTFLNFNDINEVPYFGISVGLGTIIKCSKEVFLVIHGSHKKKAFEKLCSVREFTKEWPASFIYECENSRIFVDKQAADGLFK